ncbi:proteoglycan 4b [Syngnathoides biaculeatus]|uniref:proteoglycan 4b n=1 Tax=Syngnathoides biaculeatus TaxID=300417 RepID=UPI002ADE2EAE|nr:proteoglycan 4b [Syngnathoides biaculeatus]
MSLTLLRSFILLACAVTPIVSQTSCRGRCGIEYYRGYLCQCDYSCVAYGECCLDFESQCTTKNSCRGRCGESFKRGQLCSCDSDCVKFKQCCPDYKIHCDAEEETANEAEQPNLALSAENEEDNYEVPGVNPVAYTPDNLNDGMYTETIRNDELPYTEVTEENQTPDSNSGYGSFPTELVDVASTQAKLITDTAQASTEAATLAMTASEDEVKLTTTEMADGVTTTAVPNLATTSESSLDPSITSIPQEPSRESPTTSVPTPEPSKESYTPSVPEEAFQESSTPSFPAETTQESSTPSIPQEPSQESSTSSVPPPDPSQESSTPAVPQEPSQESSTSSVPPPEPSQESSTPSVPQEPSQESSTSSVPPPEPSQESSTPSVPQEPSQESSTSSVPPPEPSQDSSTPSVPQEPSQESSTSSLPPPEPSQESSTPVVPQEPSQESSTSSVPPPEPSQDSSTPSVPQEPSQESSTSSLPPPEPSQESSTPSVPQEPSQESSTSSLPPPEPSQDSSTPSVPQEPSQESSTSSVPPPGPSQESSTPSVPQEPSQESSTPAFPPETTQESFTPSVPQEPSQESSPTLASKEPTQESSTEVKSSEAPMIPDSTTMVPPSTTLVVTTHLDSSPSDPKNPTTSAPPAVSDLDIITTVDPSPLDVSQAGISNELTPAKPSSNPQTVTQKPTSPQSSKPTPKAQDEPNPSSLLTTTAPVEKPALKPGTKPVEAVQMVDSSRDYQADDSNDTNLCSGRPASAVTTLRNGTIVVFRGHYFWFLNRNRVPGPARDITQAWGVPSPIDTVFTRCNCQGKTYIFKGNQYWRFENNNLDPGYPKLVETGFDGLRGHITAALPVPQHRGRRESVYFFKRGGLVQKYSYKFGTSPSCNKKKPQFAIYTIRNRVARHAESLLGPTINIRTTWRGFPTTVTSAVSVPSYREPEGYRYYVFSRTKSYNIRMDGERPVVPPTRETPSAQNNNFINCPKKL